MSLLLGRQHNRILRVKFPNDDGPGAELLAEEFEGWEGLSRDFRYRVVLLSDDARIDLEQLQGKLMCVSLVRADGSLRHFTGHVQSFRHTHTNGGFAFYEAMLVPWLHYLRLRENCRAFHHQTLQRQLDDIFQDYGALPRWEWKLVGEQREFTMCIQWNESDHNYICARLEAAGLNYAYEHDDKGHTWVVKEDTRDAAPIDGFTPAIRFHSSSGSEDENGIAHWRPRRDAVPSQYIVSGFDFKSPRPVRAEVPTLNTQGDIPALEVHRYEGHYGFTPGPGADTLARQRMEALEAQDRLFEAEGNNAFVQPGRWFQLTDHFVHKGDEAQFLVVEVTHHARNNYLQNEGAVAEYKNRFVCQRKSIVWRPARNLDSTRTQILAPQTALVVGPEGQGSLNVDEYGRVQVRFHWDRDETMSCWVRVATNWAGAENGLLSHPRVGSEVLIQWLDGNPDAPLVTAGVFNQSHMPPWKLPEQHTLTGLRSRELTGSGGNSAGGRSNHLILDDAAAGIQVQAKSDHLCSQLSLGHITRIEDTAGRKDARGQGFELHSEGHGVVRAGKGLLVTAELRQNARAHMTDMGETVARLSQGEGLHRSLSDAALQAQAHQAGDQDDVVQALKAQNADIEGQGGDAATGEFPEFQAPHLTLASPAGIESTSQRSTHIASNEHNALTSGGHTSISAGKSLLASVQNAIRLFACKAGLKLVAAGGDIDITALKDSINLLAKLNITHTANRITLTAKEELVINGGGSFTQYTSTGITHGTTGPWTVQAAGFSHTGPASKGTPGLPQSFELSKGNLDVFHEYVKPGGERVRGAKQAGFQVLDAEGGTRASQLDGNGFNTVSAVPMGQMTVTYEPDPSDPWDDGSVFSENEWPAKQGSEGQGSGASGTSAASAAKSSGAGGRSVAPALAQSAVAVDAAQALPVVVSAVGAAAGMTDTASMVSTAAQWAKSGTVPTLDVATLAKPALQTLAKDIVPADVIPALPAGIGGAAKSGEVPVLSQAPLSATAFTLSFDDETPAPAGEPLA